MQKCIRRKIAYANAKGTIPDVVGEQYIEFPHAICDVNGIPNKGQKSLTTKFYEARYNQQCNIILNAFTGNWIPQTVILESMFLINTKPLQSHTTMAHFGKFLMKRFILTHFRRGTTEVHLLFANPGRQRENPKTFERNGRDTAASLPANHICFVFAEETHLPSKWHETLKCRKCKWEITVFLASYILNTIQPTLMNDQRFVTAGAFEDHSDIAMAVTSLHSLTLIKYCSLIC